jgi:YD repeat-containing protein
MTITFEGLTQLGYKDDIDFVLQNDSDGNGTYIASWLSSDAQPTVSEIEAAHTTWQTDYDAQDYARSRLTEYPTIQECVHAILDDDLVALQVLRQAVKDKYPK